MLSRRYNLVNNVCGWIVFAIALVTYWLTLEPTASFWDCGEFIIQADKLEVGHPPGNPIFMLTARFFANFAGSDVTKISLMVNAMSGLLSALTILLLFWTITHLVRRLIVRDSDTRSSDDSAENKSRKSKDISLTQYLLIMGSGVVGALAYCWSDTFWFSAVEGEVYAFSSFCTALVFWLILKWENRADDPHSDRYLIMIAYVIGISVAVHLLNLLCIPAIVLVFAYRKYKNMNLVKSLMALGVSFVIIALVLFGLVPGFIKMAQQFELLFVNGLGLSYNSGALFYAFLTAGVFIWALYSLWQQRSALMIRISFILAVALSGMFFMGSGWMIGIALLILLCAWFYYIKDKGIPVRVLSNIMWSIAVIFIGYSSYALILVRSSADTPMNQNSPDNVFDLASYLNREQYGENPLIYGETLYSGPMKKQMGITSDTVAHREDGSAVVANYPVYDQVVEKGKPQYVKGVRGAVPTSEYAFLDQGEIDRNAKLAARGKDYYVKRDYKPEVKMNPELNMLFPRIYSRMHRDAYRQWVTLDTVSSNMREIYAVDNETGEKVPELDLQGEPFINQMTGMVNYPQKLAYRPTYLQNLEYFFNYQLTHMYMRYFMWNFAGRQNDVLNQHGEMDAGNWISGIPFIDNARLGDQSLLPDDLGKGNKGHNVYYFLPLIFGLIGLVWQSFKGKRGIEQFWVVFFLFFMTGIAIVLYLNQPPNQPRDRDYAFAGSFYAFAIWIGMGVAGLWQLIRMIAGERKVADKPYVAAAVCLVGLAVPLQMVSQTWDDHDRSGRYAARDFAVNYLNSLEPSAIIFCNGDNDTFPLWYAQEVEGIRPDVKIINLSYLASDWYANQMRQESYEAAPVNFTAKPEDIAYGKADVTILGRETAPADLLQSLKLIYSGQSYNKDYRYNQFPSRVVTIPVDKKKVIERDIVAAKDSAEIVDEIVIDLGSAPAITGKGYVSLGELLMLDIIATNAANGWERPIYWCSTVGNEYHVGLTDYLRGVGMAHQLVPTRQSGIPARADRAYDVVLNYKWGGADKATEKWAPYFDETVRRILVTTRSSMLDVAQELIYEGDKKAADGDRKGAEAEYRKALKVADSMNSNLSENVSRFGVSVALTLPEIYGELGDKLGDKKLTKRAVDMLWNQMERFIQYVVYQQNIALNFGNVPLTMESQYMPYQYWHFIELYKQYGGDEKKLDQLLKRYGFNQKDLKAAYDHAYGNGTADSSDQQYSVDEYIEELAAVAKIVNELAALSPEEYAKRPLSDRQYDTVYYEAYQQYLKAGITKQEMDANPEIRKVDMARSKRLAESYGM